MDIRFSLVELPLAALVMERQRLEARPALHEGVHDPLAHPRRPARGEPGATAPARFTLLHYARWLVRHAPRPLAHRSIEA